MPENTQPTHEPLHAGDDSEQPKPATKVVLLKDLGPSLPVGVLEGKSSLSKEMDHKPWKLKQERQLGEMRAKHKDANVAQYVSMVLGTMYKNLGGLNLDDMSLSDKRGKIGRMFMGDVFYSYLWLRCVSLGHIFETHVTCPFCNFKFMLPADLNTIEVTVADDIEACKWVYELQDPFEVQGTTITKFEMGPARWRALENGNLGAGLNTGIAKALIIRGCIWGVPELQRGALSEADLDEMTKRDFEAMTAEIDARSIGPDMSIEETCPRCTSDFKIGIDWGYDNFFASSSRSGPRNR